MRNNSIQSCWQEILFHNVVSGVGRTIAAMIHFSGRKVCANIDCMVNSNKLRLVTCRGHNDVCWDSCHETTSHSDWLCNLGEGNADSTRSLEAQETSTLASISYTKSGWCMSEEFYNRSIHLYSSTSAARPNRGPTGPIGRWSDQDPSDRSSVITLCATQ